MRTFIFAALAVWLGAPAVAQSDTPASNKTSPMTQATTTKVDTRPARSTTASATKTPKNHARPAYNINEGPNSIGAFAGGKHELRAERR